MMLIQSKLINPAEVKAKKTAPATSSESELSDYSLQDTGNEFVMSSPDEESDVVPVQPSDTPISFLPEDFGIVKVYGKTKDKCRLCLLYTSRCV